MHRGNAMLLAGTCAGAVVAMLVVASAVRPPGPAAAAGPSLATAPSYTTSVATTATSAPPATSAKASTKPVPEGAELAALVPGKVSVLVRDRKSARDVVSYRPDATYTSASLVKLLIALEALKQGEPASEVAEMLSRSDDDVASRLWMRLGGPAIVTSWAKRIGMTSTRPPADAAHWGSTLVTATDLARLYAYLMDGAPEGSRQVILRALDGATEHGADGFDQFFGIPGAVTAADWAVKQGWSCCDPGRNLHTSGLVGGRRYIVVVLSAQPAATSWAKASQNITAVVKALSGPLGWS
ncbi:serine hydrolase [Amycolatopsis sp. NPDC051371]|uniref:serine hydrolase n=1 Tax=Amycolatopsis sp. NPDC051371 TaxID=3155800 RepID=UPI003439F246